MNDRENEKKQREVAECEAVAAEINSQFGTDYVAKPSNIEPADVVLKVSVDVWPS